MRAANLLKSQLQLLVRMGAFALGLVFFPPVFRSQGRLSSTASPPPQPAPTQTPGLPEAPVLRKPPATRPSTAAA